MPRLVSILMPVKNTATFLAECLDSICQQSLTDWELIAINDHSTDHSLEILEQYAKKDRRIQVFTNPNKGIISALRFAYQQAQGTFITRMDSDDIMPIDKLTIMSQQLHQVGQGHLATGLVQYFSATPLGNGYKSYEQWLNQLTQTGNNFSELYKECVIPSPCWMVYRTDLEACDAFNPDRYPEDYDLCFRFYEQGLTCLPSQHILHHWRDSEGRTSRHDPNYANNTFLDLKIHYFLKLNYDKNRPLVLWGAGKKGKYIAKQLVEQNIPFHWTCNNDKKIGKSIYNAPLFSTDLHHQLYHGQFIIAIAEPQSQQNIKQDFIAKGLTSMKDYFFFC